MTDTPKDDRDIEARQALQYVSAPHYRGYAHLGIGAYLLNHSATDQPAELVISVATEEEKAGRVIGDLRDNIPGALIRAEDMAIRIRFENVAGLDALENQLRHLRAVHFPEKFEHSIQDPAYFQDDARPAPEALGAAKGVTLTDALDVVRELVAFLGEPAPGALDAIGDEAKFSALMKEHREREDAALKRARAILAKSKGEQS